MKRLIFAVIAIFSLFIIPISAAAPAEQIIELTTVGDAVTFVATEPTTFWESPALDRGETVTTQGKLTLINNTDTSRDITFGSVELPYHNKEALEYLNHVILTLKCEDEVLYAGPYSRINDKGSKPDISLTLPAGESVTYTIALRCDYTYTGTDHTGNSVLDWQFETLLSDEDTAYGDPSESFSDPMLLQWLIAGVVTGLILAGATVYLRKTRW
jgi:hypothetical protein